MNTFLTLRARVWGACATVAVLAAALGLAAAGPGADSQAQAAATAGALIYVANDEEGRLDVHDETGAPGPGDGTDTAFDDDDEMTVGNVDRDVEQEVVVTDTDSTNDDTGRVDVLFGAVAPFVADVGDDEDQVAVGDVTGDGVGEIITAEFDNGFLDVYDVADGTAEDIGGFDSNYDDGDDGFAVGDVTGDGKVEVVVADQENGAITITDTGGDLVSSFDSAYDGGDEVDGLAVGDVTGDGRAEVIVANAGEEGRIDILHAQDGEDHDPGDSVATVDETGFDDDEADKLAAGDVDADGLDEVLIANAGEDGRIDVLHAGPGDDDVDTRFNSNFDNNAENTSEDDFAVGQFGSGDLDTDGIPDRIELTGLNDEDGNPVPGWNLPDLGASPCRKDVFVEIDYMSDPAAGIDRRPEETALNRIVDAFADAPIDPVPDCPYEDAAVTTGINLVYRIDDTNLVPLQATIDPREDLAGIKADETELPGNVAQYIHYNLWANDLSGRNAGAVGLCCFGPTGLDYVVSLGTTTPDPDKQSDTFMHELGHSLGLDHGGPDSDVDDDVADAQDNINCKPNYLSQMNYALDRGMRVDGSATDKVFDFSREALPALRESPVDGDDDNLSETELLGVTEHPEVQTVWTDDSGTTRRAAVDEAIDWNFDGDTDDKDLAIDLNADSNELGDICESAGADEVIEGADDWDFLNRAGLRSQGKVSTDELTVAESERIQEFWDTELIPDTTVALNAPLAGFDSASLGVAMDAEHVYATHFYAEPAPPLFASPRPGSLVVLDRDTMQVTKRIPVGFKPAGVAVNDRTGRIYVINVVAPSLNVSVIDRSTMSVIAEVPIGNTPSDIAVNPRTNRVYVANPFASRIDVIDGATNTRLPSIPVARGGLSLAVDETTDTIHVAHNHRSSAPTVTALGSIVDDGQTTTVLPLVPLGEEGVQPNDVAVDPANDRIYVGGLGGGGTRPNLTALDRTTRTVVQRVDLRGPAREIAVNANAHRVVVASDRGVDILDDSTLEVLRRLDTAEAGIPFSVAADTGPGRDLHVGDLRTGDLRRFSYTSGNAP